MHNEDNAGVDKGALEIESAVIPSDSPLAAAFAQLTNLATGAASKETQEAPQQQFNYRNLVGFDKAIASMAKLGVGRAKDPEFAQFLEMLNFRHGMPGMPGWELLFSVVLHVKMQIVSWWQRSENLACLQ